MPDLARPIPRPGTAKTKILLVRPGAGGGRGMRSVRKTDEPDRLPIRLAIGVIVAIGVIGVVWLLGYVGFKLGFASRIVSVPDLLGEFEEGLITGTMMVIAIPRLIIMAGIANPLVLMIAFTLVAIPAASLAATKLRTPGGPKATPLEVTFSYTGAIAAGVSAAGFLWWTASPFRATLLEPLPFDILQVEDWISSLQTLAGLDVMAVVAASLWAVLVMRLTIPLWFKALVASACFFALVVVAVAMAISNASVTHVEAGRSLVFLDDGALQPRLLIGETRKHVVTLDVQGASAMVRSFNHPESLTVVGSQSIVAMLRDRANQVNEERDR